MRRRCFRATIRWQLGLRDRTRGRVRTEPSVRQTLSSLSAAIQGGQVTNGYRIPPQGTPIIQLDINPEELGRNYPIQLGMQGDVRNTLRRMLAAETTVQRTEWVNRVQELVTNWRESVSEKVNSERLPMLPERLCCELTDYLPSDAILVSDTGHSGIWTGTMIDFKHPDQSFIRYVFRVVGMGCSRGDGCEVRTTRQTCAVLYRRRRYLVSSDGVRYGDEVWD